MNDSIPYLLNLILNAVEAVALLLFGSCFFNSKFHGKKLAAIFFGLLASNVIVHSLLEDVLAVKFLAVVLVDSAWLYYNFETDYVKCGVVSVFFLSLMAVIDSAFIMLIIVLFPSSSQRLLTDMFAYYTLCYTVKMVEFLGIAIFRLKTQIIKSQFASSWREWVRVIMFPVMSIVIAMLLFRVYSVAEETADIILLCSIILLLTDILGIVLLNHLEEQQKQLQDYSVLQRLMKTEWENAAAWMTAYSNQRERTHEFQNQLAVIRGLVKRGNADAELLQYLEALCQTDFLDTLFVNTGRPIADAVLNQKCALAQSKSIKFEAQLDNLAEFALPDDAFVVVLSNLIDNAIEASEKIEDVEKRIIKLGIEVNPKSSFLYIENHTAAPVIIKDNRIRSTKQDGFDHGYGLTNVFRLLEQNNGVYTLDYDDVKKLFRFIAQITPPDENEPKDAGKTEVL